MGKALLGGVFRAVNACVPKDKRLIVFMSTPDFADNPLALHRWAQANASGEWTLRWLFRDRRSAPAGDDGLGLDLWSLRGLWTVLRARAFVTSHNELASLVCRQRQLLVSLGHGIYVKTMGYTKPEGHSFRSTSIKRSSLERFRRSCGLMIASSPLAKAWLSACYHVDAGRIAVTGLPRMDDIYVDPEHRGQVVRRFFGQRAVDKLFMFMPTHRRDDGESGGGMNGIAEALLSGRSGRLHRVLEAHSAAVLVKPHPFDASAIEQVEAGGCGDRIRFAREAEMADWPLNRIVGSADALITDYSSVYCEYLVLDRPMIFTTGDLEEYEHTRGLLLSPYGLWAPGPHVADLEELADAVERVCEGEDGWSAARQRVRRLLVSYPDDQSSRRTWAAIEQHLGAAA